MKNLFRSRFTVALLPAFCMGIFGGCGAAKGVSVGDPAPEVSLTDYTGEDVSPALYRGEKVVVLYFYPKDDTPGCTTQACTFRDSYEAFTNAGAVVIGVSGDSAESHESFADAYKLPFHLAVDADGSARKAFGVGKTMGVLPGRVTFVIDKAGIIRHIFSSQTQPKKHVDEARDRKSVV